jgi:hypothetical protein
MDERHHKALMFLRDNLGHLGKVVPIGSALKNKAFSRGHDFDILLHCENFSSKEFITYKISRAAIKWNELEELALHVFVVGPFTEEYINSPGLLIHYVPPWGRHLLWTRILVQKFIRFLSKKYKSTKLKSF